SSSSGNRRFLLASMASAIPTKGDPVTKYRMRAMDVALSAGRHENISARQQADSLRGHRHDLHDRKPSIRRVHAGTRGYAPPTLPRVQGAPELGRHRERRHGDRRIRRAQADLPAALYDTGGCARMRPAVADDRTH